MTYSGRESKLTDETYCHPKTKAGLLYPDPYDCTMYWQCGPSGPVHWQCPGGLHFNPEGYCDYPETAGCIEVEPTDPPPTTESTTTSTT